jgi:hypothetical protein
MLRCIVVAVGSLVSGKARWGKRHVKTAIMSAGTPIPMPTPSAIFASIPNWGLPTSGGADEVVEEPRVREEVDCGEVEGAGVVTVNCVFTANFSSTT